MTIQGPAVLPESEWKCCCRAVSVDFLREPCPGEALAVGSPQTDLLLALLPLQPPGPAQLMTS